MSKRVFSLSGNVAPVHGGHTNFSGFCHSHHDALTCRK